MKALFKNIIDAKAATMAGALIVALEIYTRSELEIPPFIKTSLMALAAVLAIFSGPNKR